MSQRLISGLLLWAVHTVSCDSSTHVTKLFGLRARERERERENPGVSVPWCFLYILPNAQVGSYTTLFNDDIIGLEVMAIIIQCAPGHSKPSRQRWHGSHPYGTVCVCVSMCVCVCVSD